MNASKDRYSEQEIRARISDKTLAGMSRNIDDLCGFGRVLSIQDDAYDERFERLEKFIKDQTVINSEILVTLKGLKDDIGDLKDKVNGLETKINELGLKVDKTRTEMEGISAKVECLDKDVQRLKRMNSYTSIAIRIGIGVALAVAICALLFA